MSLENFIESNKVFLRIIEEQQRQIGELETKLEQREYNRRFTNTKFKTVIDGHPLTRKKDDPRMKVTLK